MSIRLIGDDWVIEKAPAAKLVYGFDLVAKGWISVDDTIIDLDVSVVGATLMASNIVGSKVLARISEGTIAEPAYARYHWTLDNGDEDVRTIYFIIKER